MKRAFSWMSAITGMLDVSDFGKSTTSVKWIKSGGFIVKSFFNVFEKRLRLEIRAPCSGSQPGNPTVKTVKGRDDMF